MHSVDATLARTLHTSLIAYATVPVGNCIGRINELVFSYTRIADGIGKAFGPLITLGIVAVTARVANIAWNKKCTSKTTNIRSRSFALILTAFASYVTLGTVNLITDRKLLSLATVGTVLFFALRSTNVKASNIENTIKNDQEERTRLEESAETLAKQNSKDTDAAPEKALKADVRDLIDQETAAKLRLKNAPEIAKKRAEQKLAKQQDQEKLEIEERKFTQYCKFEEKQARALLNLKRVERLFAKLDFYKKELQNQRENILELFSYFLSEMQSQRIKILNSPISKRTPAQQDNQDPPKSRIRVEIQYLKKIEDRLITTQRWIQNSDLTLRKSVDEAIDFKEEAKQFWRTKDPNAELRTLRINQNPIDQKAAEAFGHLVELWNLRLENEIKTTSKIVQHRLFQIQAYIASEELEKLNEKKIPLVSELQNIVSQEDVKAKDLHTRLELVENDIALRNEQIGQLSERIEKTKVAYERLIKNDEDLDGQLKIALHEFQAQQQIDSNEHFI